MVNQRHPNGMTRAGAAAGAAGGTAGGAAAGTAGGTTTARTTSWRASAGTAGSVRQALLARTEIALVDVRPEGLFAEGHPLFAASLPLGRLEAEVFDRLPRRSVPVVVYGDGDEDTAAAVRRLRELGYGDVSALDGGLAGWTAAGGELFRDVNAPSKAFGELVAATLKTPSIPAGGLAELIAGGGTGGGTGSGTGGGTGGRCVVVDARRFDEYAVMSIPTATSVPGAELVLRAAALAPDPATTIVVNCAGRTRSIIGAQSLINARIPNKVMALENGTIGWTLAGLELDHGRSRRAPIMPAEVERAQAAGWAVAARLGLRRVTPAELAALLADSRRTVYRFDVRTPEEYASGHLPGFRSAPGGQLVQETDWFAPVRGATVVLADDGGGRAATTASWLAQMNWHVVIAAAGEAAAPAAGRAALPATGGWVPARPPAPETPLVGPGEVDEWQRAGTVRVIDIDTSPRFHAGHLPGAAWALRGDLPRLTRTTPGQRRTVLTSADGYLAAWAASDLNAGYLNAGYLNAGDLGVAVAVLADGTDGWARSGRPLASSGGGGSGDASLLSPPVDVYRRPYEGTDVDAALMQAYLDWEYGLVAQLERDGTHGFTVLVP
jgi:rhodanese-related sulfurtransferase